LNAFHYEICVCFQAVFASKVEIKDKQAEVMREIDGGSETIRVKLPAVITADLRLNQPRFANLPSIQVKSDERINSIESFGFVFLSLES